MEGLSAIWAVIYLAYAYFVLRRELAHGQVAKTMVLYSSVAIIFETLHAVQNLSWLDFLGKVFWTWHRSFGIFFSGIFFLAITFAFFNNSKQQRWWIILTVSGALSLLFIMVGMAFPGGYLTGEFWNYAISGGILVGWMILLTANGLAIVRAIRFATKPLHKNRIVFWGFAILILAIGDVFIFLQQDILGSLLRIAALLLTGYVVFFEDLLDLSGSIQRLPITIYKAIIAFTLYATVLSIRYPITIFSEEENRLVEWFLKVLILVVGVNPILQLFNQFVDRSSTNSKYSQSGVVRKYNLAIAQIVDLRHLAEVAINEIRQVLPVQHARLYLVDLVEAEGCIQMRQVIPTESDPSASVDVVKLSLKSTIVNQFNQMQKPLRQYDLDFGPRFFNIDKDEKEWFSEQQMDIYIPICTLDTWIGLFALGPKSSGDRYFPEDVELLITLAEQTVIALQNSRLVEDLRLTQNMLEAANEKLRTSDINKSAFISVVTHELRTPMVNIGFSLQLIELYGMERLLPEQRELIDQLTRSVQAARCMVDNLICYASFLNEQVYFNFTNFDFIQSLQENLALLKIQAEEKELLIHLELPDEPLMIFGDRKLLMDAVQHLVLNAIKFTQTGSVWIGCRVVDEAVCFEVQDTGIGIPEEKLTEIWKAFTQAASDPLLRGVEGLGLGLALVKLIIEAHGGFVWVESIRSSGSFFGFQIPIGGPAKPLDADTSRKLQRASLKNSLTWQVRQRSVYEPER